MHPLAALSVPPGQVAVHWFEQSSFALKGPGGEIVLVDPFFPHERPAPRYLHAEPPLKDEKDLPVRGVFLTHDHLDHTHAETLKRIAAAHPECRYAGPVESCKRATGEAGVPSAQFTTVNAGDSHAIGEFTAHFVYAKPPGGDPANGIGKPDVTHLGLVLACGDVRIYFSGDPINTFADLDDLTGPVKALGPQVGFLTTHPKEGEFPYFDGSARMATRVGLKKAFPAHWQCFTKRNYEYNAWAKAFEGSGVETGFVQYNGHVLLP